MKAYAIVGRPIVRATIYYVTAAFAAETVIALNYQWAPHAPIAFLLALSALVAWTATAGRRWSGYRLLKVAACRGLVAAYSASSVLLCLGVFVIAGKLSHLVSGFPPAPKGTGLGWQVQAALFTGTFAGIAEEVAFRGILQGNFARAFGPRVALAVSIGGFCALHALRAGFAVQLPFYVVLGVSTALIAHIAQSTAPGIAIHLATNTLLAAAALVWGPIEWRRLTDEAAWVALVLSGAAAAAMILVFKRMRALKLLAGRHASAEPTL